MRGKKVFRGNFQVVALLFKAGGGGGVKKIKLVNICVWKRVLLTFSFAPFLSHVNCSLWCFFFFFSVKLLGSPLW